MAIKKDAAKAPIKGPKKIPTKETVDTPISECEVEKPMECKYHGLQAFNNYIASITKNLGFNGSFEADKLQGNKGFQMKMPGFYFLANGFSDGVVNAAKNAGFDASYEGKGEDGKHLFLFKKEMPKKPEKKKAKGGATTTIKASDGGDAVESAGKAPVQSTIQLVDNLYKEISNYVQSNLEDIQGFAAKDAEWKDTYENIWVDIATHFAYDNLEGLKKLFDELKEHIEKGKEIIGDKQKEIGNWLDDGSLDDFLLGEENEDAKDAKTTMKDDAETDAWIEEQTKKEEEKAKKKTPSAKELFAGLDDGLDDVDEFLGGEDVIDNDELDDFLSGEGLEEEGNEGFTVEEIKGANQTEVEGIEKKWNTLIEKAKEKGLFQDAKWVAENAQHMVDYDKAKANGDTDAMFDAVYAMKESVKDTIEKGGSNSLKEQIQGALDALPGYTIAAVEELSNGKLQVVMEEKPDDYESLTHQQIKSAMDGFLKSIGYETGPMHKVKGKVCFSITSMAGSPVNKTQEAGHWATILQEEKEKYEAEKAMANAPSLASSSEDMLKPLEHDESRFPQNPSQAKLESAIAEGKKASGHGGLGTTIVEIDGKKYVCKSGSGKKSKIIKNGYLADMAYRAGGIYVPDAKLYEFGDGKTYKLSEFVEGKKLIDVWKSADEGKRNEIRKELLKGYPLDALFSNYDVLGTSPEESQTVTITGMDGKPQKTHVAFDNVIVGNDGNVYRIDNDGAFAMTGTGGVKSSDVASFSTPVDFEHWDNWADRQWIDDFRTLRVNEKNAGIFDRYSTADIFLSASKVDYDSMEKALESNPALKQALLKPLFELKQMAFYAHGAEVAGYKNQRGMSWKSSNGHLQTIECDPLSMALDAIYNGHKAGIRKFLQKKVSWMDTGWLSGSSGSSQAYVPKAFQKPEPQEPKPPTIGIDMAKEVLEGIKTIAYNAKQGDYKPNESRIKKALATKPFVEVMANAGNERAKGLLEAIGKIEESIKTGHKKALEFNTADGLFDANGLSLVVDADNSALYAKHIEPIHSKWEKEHAKWFDEKKKWDAAEMEQAKKAGAAPTKDFQSYEDMLVTANINTNGIQQGGGNPSVNHESKTAQKGTSFSKKACLKKVRQYAMMGLSLDDMDFANGDKTFYNGNVENGGYHVSGGDGVENYKWAVKYYRDHPEEFKQAMQAYAVHKGMLVLCHANMDNPAIDHNLLTCFVMRGEHKQAWGKDGKGAPTQEGIIKPYPIDSSASACINATGHFGAKKIGWKLPIWRITDNFMIGAGSEEEICINPINIPYPPMYFTDTSGGWQACMAKYNKQEAVKAIDKKLGKAEEQ